MGHTGGGPGEIELTAIGVELNGSRHVPALCPRIIHVGSIRIALNATCDAETATGTWLGSEWRRNSGWGAGSGMQHDASTGLGQGVGVRLGCVG